MDVDLPGDGDPSDRGEEAEDGGGGDDGASPAQKKSKKDKKAARKQRKKDRKSSAKRRLDMGDGGKEQSGEEGILREGRFPLPRPRRQRGS